MEISVNPLQFTLINTAARFFKQDFYRDVVTPLARVISPHPRAVTETIERIDNLISLAALVDARGMIKYSGDWADLIRCVLVRQRLMIAADVETKLAIAHEEKLIQQLHALLAPYDTLIKQSWFRAADPFRPPRLVDYVVMEYAQRINTGNSSGREPVEPRNLANETDEKFHILRAPQFFIPDIDATRTQCELRDIDCAVAFIDIDHFKDFNTRYTESIVDQRVLPKFMRKIEGAVFAKGYGYRFGGDEYVVLLHNASIYESHEFMQRLRQNLADLNYPEISDKTTVSIGLVHVPSGCPFTSQEILKKASSAKAKAKEDGRNRIATYTDKYYEELSILPTS